MLGRRQRDDEDVDVRIGDERLERGVQREIARRGPRPAFVGVAAEDGDQTGARRVAGEEMLRVPHAVPAESGQPDAEDVFGHVCHPGAAP